MNVIFLDFDGVLDTYHAESNLDIERRIKILADICKEYDCKIVIEASAKDAINEETLEVDDNAKWIKHIFDCFKKYGITCIGRTPTVEKRYNKYSYLPIWKEDEIRLYLCRHPEIDHYCVIDDDDLAFMHRKSDLDKVRNHLVKTLNYSDNVLEEGLLEKHKMEVEKALKEDNEVKKLCLRKKMLKQGEK